MKGVLNETTRTVHRHEIGAEDLQAACGATTHLAPDNLRVVSVESTASDPNTLKCGRCFRGEGGY